MGSRFDGFRFRSGQSIQNQKIYRSGLLPDPKTYIFDICDWIYFEILENARIPILPIGPNWGINKHPNWVLVSESDFVSVSILNPLILSFLNQFRVSGPLPAAFQGDEDGFRYWIYSK